MLDSFNVILPISGVSVNVLLLILLGTSVGVLGGFFGMGGAWMVTPALNIFGFPMPFAVGTDMCHMAGKSIISTRRHAKFGNVDAKLGLTMLAFDVVGIEIGARLVMMLESRGLAGPVIRWVYVVFLFLIGSLVFYDYFKKRALERRGDHAAGTSESAVQWYVTLHRINLPPIVDFKVAQVRCSMWLPATVGLFVGVLAGFLGIGGGLIMMPALVYSDWLSHLRRRRNRSLHGDALGRLWCLHVRDEGSRGAAGRAHHADRRRPGRPDRDDCHQVHSRIRHPSPVRPDGRLRAGVRRSQAVWNECGGNLGRHARRERDDTRHHRRNGARSRQRTPARARTPTGRLTQRATAREHT